MNRFQAVVFDMDGTLLDTLADIGNSVNRVLEAEGFPIHPLDAYRYFVGDGSAILVKRSLPAAHRNPETIERCLRLFQADYGNNWKNDTRLYDGIPELLDALVAKGLRLAILSNKYHSFTLQCADWFLGPWPFEVILGIRPSVPPKPDPFAAGEIAALLRTPPEQCLYVGDTSVDMQTGLSAGMFPVGVLWGFRTRAELEENGARIIISHPLDLLDVLSGGTEPITSTRKE